MTDWLVAESTSVDSVPTARLLMAVAAVGVLSEACLEGRVECEEAGAAERGEDVKNMVQLSH